MSRLQDARAAVLSLFSMYSAVHTSMKQETTDKVNAALDEVQAAALAEAQVPAVAPDGASAPPPSVDLQHREQEKANLREAHAALKDRNETASAAHEAEHGKAPQPNPSPFHKHETIPANAPGQPAPSPDASAAMKADPANRHADDKPPAAAAPPPPHPGDGHKVGVDGKLVG